MANAANLTDSLDAAGLRVDRDGAVLTIWLARPNIRNAQTPSMWRGLAALGSSLEPDIDVVVLRGEGTSFSSGLDRRMFAEGVDGEPSLASMAGLSEDEFASAVEQFQRGFTVWRDVAPIVVAAVHGSAIGAGFQLALAADFIIAADDATFSMREARLGLVPDLAGTTPLVEAVGYAKALEICATGRDVDAAEALSLGFVSRVFSSEDFDAGVTEVVDSLRGNPLRAAIDVKRVLRGSQSRSRDEQRERERRIQHGRVVKLATAFGAQ